MSGSNDKINLLLVGPLPIEADVIGGAKVSFAFLVQELRSIPKFRIIVVNSSRGLKGQRKIGRLFTNIWHAVRVLYRTALHLRWADVMIWNVSSRAALLIGPLFWALARLQNCKFIVRFFGAGILRAYENADPLRKWLFRNTICKSNLILLQTRSLVDEFPNTSKVKWFPTSRNLKQVSSAVPVNCRKFLFLSQIRDGKGVPELLQAFAGLPSSASLSLFGSIIDGHSLDGIDQCPNVQYFGELLPGEVPLVLSDHDALVLPTKFSSEGYPGSVIEAFQMSLPVVTTNIRSLQEFVINELNGLIVPVGSVDHLKQAMLRLHDDDELYRRLCLGAYKTGDDFRSTNQVNRLKRWIQNLTDEEKVTRVV